MPFGCQKFPPPPVRTSSPPPPAPGHPSTRGLKLPSARHLPSPRLLPASCGAIRHAFAQPFASDGHPSGMPFPSLSSSGSGHLRRWPVTGGDEKWHRRPRFAGWGKEKEEGGKEASGVGFDPAVGRCLGEGSGWRGKIASESPGGQGWGCLNIVIFLGIDIYFLQIIGI
jgi:hypothetical protein